MRKLISILLVLLLLVTLFTACAKNEKPDTPPEESTEPTPTDAPTAPPEAPTDAPEPTEPEWVPDGSVMPNVVDLCRGTIENYGMAPDGSNISAEYAIPQIDMPGPYIEAINAEIREVTGYDSDIEEYGEFIPGGVLNNYEWYVNGDILSLVLLNQFYWRPEYEIYNIRISTCKPATTEEVLEAAGVYAIDFYDNARMLLINTMFDYWGTEWGTIVYPDGRREGSFMEFTTMQGGVQSTYRELIAEENIKESIPYLGENGDLYFRGTVKMPVGAGDFQELMKYTDTYELSPYYEYYLITPKGFTMIYE